MVRNDNEKGRRECWEGISLKGGPKIEGGNTKLEIRLLLFDL